ncbi:MAG TPA: GntR family transcriptional regulator, partial [Chloroflexota bacterium]
MIQGARDVEPDPFDASTDFDPASTNEPLSDGVYRVLVDAIVRGALRPNERLTEQRLAEVTGASRTPIREAVRRLEAEGLLERIPHRGVTVASLPGFTEDE